MEDKLNSFVEKVKSALGEDIRSFILYGSKASAEEGGKNSDYNTLLILSDAGYLNHKKLLPVTAQWLKAGSPAPQVFSERMFGKSADVFPLEFLDMQAHHKVLAGEDPFKGLAINTANLRHQCEFELKSKLLGLRQAYLAAQGRGERLKAVMTGSISSVLVIFRHTVRLIGQEPPDKKLDALAILSERAGFSREVFLAVYKLKNGEKDALNGNLDSLMGAYLTELEKAVNFIDDLK